MNPRQRESIRRVDEVVEELADTCAEYEMEHGTLVDDPASRDRSLRYLHGRINQAMKALETGHLESYRDWMVSIAVGAMLAIEAFDRGEVS